VWGRRRHFLTRRGLSCPRRPVEEQMREVIGLQRLQEGRNRRQFSRVPWEAMKCPAGGGVGRHRRGSVTLRKVATTSSWCATSPTFLGRYFSTHGCPLIVPSLIPVPLERASIPYLLGITLILFHEGYYFPH